MEGSRKQGKNLEERKAPDKLVEPDERRVFPYPHSNLDKCLLYGNKATFLKGPEIDR